MHRDNSELVSLGSFWGIARFSSWKEEEFRALNSVLILSFKWTFAGDYSNSYMTCHPHGKAWIMGESQNEGQNLEIPILKVYLEKDMFN